MLLFVTSLTITHQAPLSMEFSRQEYWSALPFPSPGDLPYSEIEPMSPALIGGFFTTELPGKPYLIFSSVQSLSHVRLFVTPWAAACQASLSITNSRSPPKPMSIELVMPSNHLILCHPLLLLPSIFPRIRVFSNDSALHIRWPKYWSFSFNIRPSNEQPGLIFKMDWLDLLAVPGTVKSLLQHHSSKASILLRSAFFIVQLSHPYMTTRKTIAMTRRASVGKVMFLTLLSFKIMFMFLINILSHILKF